MKINRPLILLTISILLPVLICGCSFSKKEARSLSFFAMDTFMTVTAYGDDDLSDVEKLVHELDKLLSVTDSRSEIYKLNSEKKITPSQVTSELLKNALLLCKDTDGALDITVYPLVSAWGFTTDSRKVPEAALLSSRLPAVDYRLVSIDEVTGEITLPADMSIDLGAVTKGYTGDSIIALLKQHGIENALINLGGNIQVIGTRPDKTPWKIAVTNPADTGSIIGYVSVSDAAVITSGSYQRFFEEDGKKYHHIIDPSTGYPADNGLTSVTVIGESGLRCDALSTALFVMGLEKGIEYWKNYKDFEVIWIDESNTVFVTEGAADRFTPAADTRLKTIRR